MAFGSKVDETVDKLLVRKARGFPELGVHADAGEAGHSIDFVEVDPCGLRFPAFFVFDCGLHKEVDAGEAGAVAGAEGGDGHLADLL